MPKNENNADQTLRRTVVDLLAMRGAHADFDHAIADLPARLAEAQLPGPVLVMLGATVGDLAAGANGPAQRAAV